MAHLRLARRGKHSPKAKENTKQGSVLAILASLRSLGVKSLDRRLISIAICSLIGGLSQAALLVILSELAVSRAQGGGDLKLHGFSISLNESLLVCAGLLILFFVFSITAAFASSSMSSSAVEAGRGKVMSSFFKASWEVQSAERLGHVQQLLTVNCDNIGILTQSISNRHFFGARTAICCFCGKSSYG